MEGGFINGGIPELKEAKAAIAQTNELKNAYNAAVADVSAKEKDLESQKKYASDKANSVVKERRSELKKSHDEQVDLANRNLKEAEKKRKSAKNEAVQTRITSETSGEVGAIEDHKRDIKLLLRENKMPGFCNSRFYYALYAPKNAGDFLIIILTVIITLGVIPNVVCLLLDTNEILIKILVYVGIVVFFVALYFLFFMISKRSSKGEALELIRTHRNGISEIKKMIKNKSRTITKDKDESSYGLEGYDAEIAEFQNALNDKMQKRDAALKNFDEVTAVELRNEIERENQPVIEKMTAELEASRQTLEDTKVRSQEASENLTNSYEVYLGKKNMTPEKIDAMIALIQEGKATTVMEAINILSGEIK